MKQLLFSLLLFCAGTVARAQAIPPAPGARRPFAGANLITIATPDSAREAILKLQRILRAQGLQIDSAGPDRLRTKGLAVAASSAGGAATVQVFRARATHTAQGTLLVLSGEYAQDLGPKYHFTFPMRWLALQNPSDNQACFLRAEKFASAYPQGVVSYTRYPLK